MEVFWNVFLLNGDAINWKLGHRDIVSNGIINFWSNEWLNWIHTMLDFEGTPPFVKKKSLKSSRCSTDFYPNFGIIYVYSDH